MSESLSIYNPAEIVKSLIFIKENVCSRGASNLIRLTNVRRPPRKEDRSVRAYIILLCT